MDVSLENERLMDSLLCSAVVWEKIRLPTLFSGCGITDDASHTQIEGAAGLGMDTFVGSGRVTL